MNYGHETLLGALKQAEQIPECSLPAGRTLDEAVAEIVMGWLRWEPGDEWREPETNMRATPPCYSTERDRAIDVVMQMRKEGFGVSIESESGASDKWHVAFDGDGFGYEEGCPMPEAICHAAIAAMCDALSEPDL